MHRASFVAVLLVLGCSGEQTQVGTAELFRVRLDANTSAQFVRGVLPGAPPNLGPPMAAAPTPDAGKASAAGEPDALPTVVDFRPPGFVVRGQGAVSVQGTATPGAASLGLALAGIGTGYWVLPVGDIDNDGNRPWTALCDFDEAIPTGYRNLRAVAFDPQGAAGQQREARTCIDSEIPDVLSACRPTTKVPESVISLSWDTNVDLDLQVQTPDGRLVEPKHPTALPPNDAGAVPPTSAAFDRDSNAGCIVDGLRTENLVWPTGAGPHGRYLIYVNLFDACKQPAVTFTVSVYSARSDGSDAGNRFLKKYFERSGELLDFQANGGASRGLFVSEFNFE
jgi:hypothetical protein